MSCGAPGDASAYGAWRAPARPYGSNRASSPVRRSCRPHEENAFGGGVGTASVGQGPAAVAEPHHGAALRGAAATPPVHPRLPPGIARRLRKNTGTRELPRHPTKGARSPRHWCSVRVWTSTASATRGRCLSPAGTKYGERGIPPSRLGASDPRHPFSHHLYRVTKDVTVRAGPIAPAFEPGGRHPVERGRSGPAPRPDAGAHGRAGADPAAVPAPSAPPAPQTAPPPSILRNRSASQVRGQVLHASAGLIV